MQNQSPNCSLINCTIYVALVKPFSTGTQSSLPCGGSPLNARIFYTPASFARFNASIIYSLVMPVQVICIKTSRPMYLVMYEHKSIVDSQRPSPALQVTSTHSGFVLPMRAILSTRFSSPENKKTWLKTLSLNNLTYQQPSLEESIRRSTKCCSLLFPLLTRGVCWFCRWFSSLLCVFYF